MYDIIEDIEQRRQAEDTTISCRVEAPAGSGKTSLLVSRYLKLLAQVENPLEILALTFTNKAAAEMRGRVADLLRRAQEHDPAQNDQDAHLLALARRALNQHGRRKSQLLSPDHLQIMTFHSFCYSLIRRAPVESQTFLQTEILADTDQELLQREATYKFMFALLDQESDDRHRLALERRLLRFNNQWYRLEEELIDILKRRDLFLDLMSEVAPHLEQDSLEQAIQLRVRQWIEHHLTTLSSAFAQGSLASQLGEIKSALCAKGATLGPCFPDRLPEALWEELPQWQLLANVFLTKDGNPRKRFGPKDGGFFNGFSKTNWADTISSLPPEVATFLHLTRQLPPVEEKCLDMKVLLDFLLLSQGAIQQYEKLLKEKKALDFVQVERAALALFSDDAPTDLQLYLDARIKHLLVDEFQDTSRNQWELIRHLCYGWEPGDGRTLFLVGDPKQSIYAFRKAEVSLFMTAQYGIPIPGKGCLPLENLYLSTNFRSQPLLIDWYNGFFQHLMQDPNPDFDEVTFQPATPAPHAISANDIRPIRMGLFADEYDDQARLAEAQWIAGEIATLLTQDPPPRSIAILPFTRAYMPVYLQACHKFGIHVQVQAGFLLIDSPEGSHLLNLTRALNQPHNDFAWAALLRAPWSWIPLHIFAQVINAEGTSLRERLLHAAARHGEIQQMASAIVIAESRLGREPLVAIVHDLWTELEGPLAVGRDRGSQGLENCRYFFELLGEAEQGLPQATLTRLEMMLNTTYEPIDPAAAHSSVQMMTVHGAKGLEFDVVFVPQLDRDPGRKPVEAQSPPYLLERVPGQNHYLIAMLPDKRLQEEDKIYQRLKQHTHSKTLAEAKRVLYVALTRARHKLYLSGIAKTVTVEDQVRIRCGQNYLSWLLNYLGIKTDADLLQASSAESSIRVELNPLGATSTSIPSSPDRVTVGNIPSGAPMKPESAPYQVWLPAKNCDAQYWIPGLDEKDFSDDRISLATTLVIHQLLQHVADGKPLPNLQQLRNALTANSLSPAEAAQVAPDLFAEIQQCLADPFLGNLLITPQPWRKTAWALAAQLSDHSLGTGIIDLVVCDGTSWWLVDYKTLRFSPKDSADDFALRLHNYYDDQISHYRQILAKRQKLALSQIRAGFYLTALQRWEEVELR